MTPVQLERMGFRSAGKAPALEREGYWDVDGPGGGLRDGKILATHCSKSGLTYLPPRSFCERTFESCDQWVELGSEGTIEASTIVVRGFEGKRPPPVAIAFVRLDGADSAIGNYVDGLDLSDLDAAMSQIRPGRRVRVLFAEKREGRITDFSFVCID
jgi:uncharacterized OB-fold protein